MSYIPRSRADDITLFFQILLICRLHKQGAWYRKCAKSSAHSQISGKVGEDHLHYDCKYSKPFPRYSR